MLISTSDSNHLPEGVLSHVQTSNHTQQDMESRNDMPTPHSPTSVADFAHYDGDKVLHCPGGK